MLLSSLSRKPRPGLRGGAAWLQRRCTERKGNGQVQRSVITQSSLIILSYNARGFSRLGRRQKSEQAQPFEEIICRYSQ